MENIVYLDNSATTKPCDEAIEYMNNAVCKTWGNPSSLHTVGINAEELVFSAKEVCAKAIGCRSDEIYFTSGGTESNNLAITGAVNSRAKRGNRIVTTEIEHPSVLETIKALEQKGFEVVYLKPDNNGKVSEEAINGAVNKNTILVSIMLVNNEIGTVQPIKAAAKAIKAAGAPALLHCDAVQGFGKINIKVNELGVDLLTFSGHKIHAPKGIGVLYKKKGVNIAPVIFGGGQQDSVRPGTESVPLIYALEGAIRALPNVEEANKKMQALCDYAKEKLTATETVSLNSPQDAIPYILNVSVLGYRSETLLHFLDAQGVFVSSGSACSKGKLSYTLSALGLDSKRIDSALRISFSRDNTKEDIDKLCDAIILATKKLKRA
ncbi:MAG: cysteine desulfurase [Clostridia bacterium]|nr:cysteine desulfurase [Clostridia bacterium]